MSFMPTWFSRWCGSCYLIIQFYRNTTKSMTNHIEIRDNYKQRAHTVICIYDVTWSTLIKCKLISLKL